MGTDNNNLSPAANLKCQVKQLNSALKELSESIFDRTSFEADLNAKEREFRKIRTEFEDIKNILNLYETEILSLENNALKTKKSVPFQLSNYFDLTSNSSFVKEYLSLEEYTDEKILELRNKVSVKINNEFHEYISNLLEKIKKYSEIDLFVKQFPKLECYRVNEDGISISNTVTIVIDIADPNYKK